MSRRSIAPLLFGTFILRANGGAATIIFGLFLAQLASHTNAAITSLNVGLLAVAYYATELVLAPVMGSLSDRCGRRTGWFCLGSFRTLRLCSNRSALSRRGTLHAPGS